MNKFCFCGIYSYALTDSMLESVFNISFPPWERSVKCTDCLLYCCYFVSLRAAKSRLRPELRLTLMSVTRKDMGSF